MGKENKKTTIIIVSQSEKKSIELVGYTTVIKQQQLQLQRQGQKNIHSHNTAIDAVIKEVHRKHQDSYHIIITIDANELFISTKGSIANVWRKCKLHDLLDYQHGDITHPGTHMWGKDSIDFILCSIEILNTCLNSGITGYGDITTTYHRGIFIDLPKDLLLKNPSQIFYYPIPEY